MNELPVMPIRVKYADETTKGVNIDSALEEAAGDTSALEERVEDLETSVGDEDSGLVKDVNTLKNDVQGISSVITDIEYNEDESETNILQNFNVDGSSKFNDVIIKPGSEFDVTGVSILGLSVGTKLYKHSLNMGMGSFVEFISTYKDAITSSIANNTFANMLKIIESPDAFVYVSGSDGSIIRGYFNTDGTITIRNYTKSQIESDTVTPL